MALATSARARTSAKGLGGALAAAVCVHALVWAFFQHGGLVGSDAALSPRGAARSTSAVAPSASGAIELRVLAEAGAPRGVGGAADAPAGGSAGSSGVSQPHEVPPPRSTAAGGEPGVSVPYWSSDALQASPHPEWDWVLDEEAFDRVHQARMLVQLWVAENGRIDRVQLLGSEPPGPWAEQALSRVGETQMRPGIKDGRAVASTVVVEIATEVERFR